ncbi:hypothetical protein BHE74_00017311 [Ensete ventricosum]|nr:hypothetical protein BHE74_00017311 [Ensete ventricosum]
MVINFARRHARSRVLVGFSCSVSEIQNTVHIPNVLALGMSYEHGFVKKCDGHKHCTKSRAKSIMFQSVFRVLSQKFKILAIPNVHAHGKSYEHGFAKKYDGHKLYAIFMHRLRNSKY